MTWPELREWYRRNAGKPAVRVSKVAGSEETVAYLERQLSLLLK